jgi:hypothetical protein
MLLRTRTPVVSSRIAILVVTVGALIALAIGTPDARAFPTYSGWPQGECLDCHGDFRANNYQPPSRDEQWTGQSLHDVHRFDMVGDCLACHRSFDFEPDISMSESGSAAFPMSCIGCHGRAEHDAGGLVTAAGLRRNHWNAGVPCTPCHADSEPAAGFAPVGEDVFPPNYDALGIDPCNFAPDLSEDFAGSALGLDNDGDGFYDEDDLDCVAPPPPPLIAIQTECGLGIELTLLMPLLLWLRRSRRSVRA